MKFDTFDELTFSTGRPWLDFVATLNDRTGDDPYDQLWDTERLAEWLHHGMGCDQDVKVTEYDLEHARWTRGTLQALADSALDDTAPPMSAVAAANRALDPYMPPRMRVEEGRLRRTAPTSVEAAMSWLVLDAMLTLSGDEVRLLQRCAAPDCRMVFVDATGRRRWCPTGRCGVKLRVRAHRERARGTSPEDNHERLGAPVRARRTGRRGPDCRWRPVACRGSRRPGGPMKFRKIDDKRSMRRPLWETDRLEPLDEQPDPDFELSERLADGLEWTGAHADGSLDQSLLRSVDLSGTSLSPFEVVDVTIERSVLSNGRWERATARRLEITDSQLVGWQTQFALAQDVYIADCRADFAGISIGTAKGPMVFERCRFMNATFLGDFSKTVFIDCAFPGADFSRVSNAKGCDLRRSELSGITGLMSLRGALITADQAVEIAGELATAAGFKLA